EAPKQLIDKLDVKPGAKVWALGVSDEPLLAQLAERTPKLSTGRTAANVDVAFVQVSRAADLPRIATASTAIVPAGAIWVVHPKGPTGEAAWAHVHQGRAGLGDRVGREAGVAARRTPDEVAIRSGPGPDRANALQIVARRDFACGWGSSKCSSRSACTARLSSRGSCSATTSRP